MRGQQLVGSGEEGVSYKSSLLVLKLQTEITPKGLSTDFLARNGPNHPHFSGCMSDARCNNYIACRMTLFGESFFLKICLFNWWVCFSPFPLEASAH